MGAAALRHRDSPQDLLAQDILCAFAPYENQESRYALLGKTSDDDWIVAQQLSTNNLINQTNNALNYQAIADTIAQAKLTQEPKTITPLLIVHRPDQDGDTPEGFVKVLNPKKRSVFIVRPLTLNLSAQDFEPTYPDSWNPVLSVSQMRHLQAYRIDSFISAKKLEQYLLDKHADDGARSMNIDNAIVLDAEMDGAASMPDVTGYSLMSQTLAQDCNIDTSEIFFPLMQSLTQVGIAMGAWIDEYAGDSIRLIFSDPSAATPNPSEKNILFSIAAHQAQQQFDKTIIRTLEEKRSDPAIEAFFDAYEKHDLPAMLARLKRFPDKQKILKLAQAFVYGRTYIRLTYGNDKYGMKTVSAQSACAFQYQGIGGTTIAQATVEHGKEILSAPSFDKDRAELERIAHEPGRWLVVTKTIYENIAMPWIKKLCLPTESAYSIDIAKAIADKNVIAYFSSIGRSDLFA